MKKYLLAVSDEKVSNISLPERWIFYQFEDFKSCLNELQKISPDMFILKNYTSDGRALDFLRDVKKIYGSTPPTIIYGLEENEEIDEDLKSLFGIIKSYKGDIKISFLLGDLRNFLDEPFLPNMNIAEFLVNAFIEEKSGIFSFKYGQTNVSIILNKGMLFAIDSEIYRNIFRENLVSGGLTLPQKNENVLEDLRTIENLLDVDKEKIKNVKILSIINFLQNFSLNTFFNFTKKQANISFDDFIQIPVIPVVKKLIENVSIDILEPLKYVNFIKTHVSLDYLKKFDFTPEEFYFLHFLENKIDFKMLSSTLGLSESTLLKRIYFFFIIGLLRPVNHKEYRPLLNLLKNEIKRKEKIALSQRLFIEQFYAMLQIPGISPYKVLGVDEKTPFYEITESFKRLQSLFNQELLEPTIGKKYSSHLTFIKTKIMESFLLLQSFFLKEGKRDGVVQSSLQESSSSKQTEQQATSEFRKKEAERLFEIAKNYFESENYHDAGEYLKTAIVYDPSLAPAHNLLGKVYKKIKSERAKYMAEKEFKTAIELDPWNSEYLLDLAHLYADENLPLRAKAILNQIERIEPNCEGLKELKEKIKKIS